MKFLILNILFVSSLLSHSLVLSLLDNEDGTIQIIGAYNTGQSAAGALIKVESLATGNLLFNKRLPDESELTFKIPMEAYQVILDGGPGHKVIKKGIEPEGGFKVKDSGVIVDKTSNNNIKQSSVTLPILWSICIVLLSLILFFWIRNTNKIILMIKNSV